jgi:hypothetical protein
MSGCLTVLPFHPEPDLVDARATIRQAVDAVLAKLQAGVVPDDAELEHVDIKERPGVGAAVGLSWQARPRTPLRPPSWLTKPPASPTRQAAER